MSMLMTITLMIIIFYIAPMIYLILYSYSEYTQSIDNTWKRYLILSIVPAVNLGLIAYLMSDIIMFEPNPLYDALSVKRRHNSKVKCNKCKANSYMWQTVIDVNHRAGYVRECPYCKASLHHLESISDNSPVVKGQEMTLREAVNFQRYSLRVAKDRKDKKLDKEYVEQERIIYGTK